MTEDDLEIASLLDRLNSQTLEVGIVGLGYVGLPMALAFLEKGAGVIGVDLNKQRLEVLEGKQSPFPHLSQTRLEQAMAGGRFRFGDDYAALTQADVIVICLPTPVDEVRTPDLSIVKAAAKEISRHLRRGQLVAFESTSWPGTTAEVVAPLLDQSGLKLGQDYFLAFSPEREDPGNKTFSTANTPKLVGADDPLSARLAQAFYARVAHVVPVSSTRVAEAAKLTENIFRSINIALVNELKITFAALGVDMWEVVEAAATKPFGFMPFYPGPGVGGHCIPVDPLYLASKAREHALSTRLIDVAADIHAAMPLYVIDRIILALDEALGRGLRGAAVLVVGVAYKKNIADMRQSPALEIIRRLQKRGAKVSYYDPFVAQMQLNEGSEESLLSSVTEFSGQDLAVIVTDHETIDYAQLCADIPVIVDTRNVCVKRGLTPRFLFSA